MQLCHTCDFESVLRCPSALAILGCLSLRVTLDVRDMVFSLNGPCAHEILQDLCCKEVEVEFILKYTKCEVSRLHWLAFDSFFTYMSRTSRAIRWVASILAYKTVFMVLT
jgi:hypothetical protein